MLYFVGHGPRTVAGCCLSPPAGGAFAPPAKADEQNEEDVPDVYEGELPASPCGEPRSVHRWVPMAQKW